MPRAYPHAEYSDANQDTGAGDWQALRGELVALLDQVESRYDQRDMSQPSLPGLAQRVRHLRDQVSTPEPGLRRREALRSVKRQVDRFSERENSARSNETDELTAAIAEIRSRQGAASISGLRRRATDLPEVSELGGMVDEMTMRLERLEGELKTQRSGSGSVREVASQVEQLTHVVELLAGAVGETGQVKRLEAQIAALGAMIEDAPRTDLSAINARLDDVSATVSKLAELQAQQMEREIAREDGRAAQATPDPMAKIAPAMKAIEKSVRNVYDRIDTIEHNVALSSTDFERLTAAMAAFTQALDDKGGSPVLLIERLETLAARLEKTDGNNGHVAGLKADIDALRDAVMQGIEPRFSALEGQIAALNGKVKPIDTGAVESQLKALMARMDDAGAQLDTMAQLYKSADMTPDYESLADMVASRTSAALAKSAPATGGVSDEHMSALETRMTALFKTAGKDTAERLTRLEAALSARNTQPAITETAERTPAPPAPKAAAPARKPDVAEAPDEFESAFQQSSPNAGKLDAIIAGLSRDQGDAMPANPADEAPLVDPGFKDEGPVRSALAAKVGNRPPPMRQEAAPAPQTQRPPQFDPEKTERPARPMSSFATQENDPFAPVAQPAVAPEPMAATSNTSTFVAAARRAQRAKQEEAGSTSDSNSLIGRALARVRTKGSNRDEPESPAVAPFASQTVPLVEEADSSAPRRKARVTKASLPGIEDDVQPSFLTRHRRPLLLAATLLAVSMLALNLVMQRSAPAPTSEPATAVEAEEAAPAAVEDEVSDVAPRVIDLVDPTSVGSINPGAPMSFSRQAGTTPMPAPVTATGFSADAAKTQFLPSETDAPGVTGSIPDVGNVPAEVFELPPEAVGPLGLREAAAEGDAHAQFEVAAIYTEGRAIEQDFAEAAKWYERAAANGFAPAQYRLGNLYEAGTGLDKDLELAKLWYQRSADAGNRMAMHNLAALYAGGSLGEQQFEQAAEWFARAAARGMTDSQFNLGMLHARGLGVEQDFEQSYKWFSLAARNGDKDAAQARDDIAKSLSAEAVSRINETLATWKPEAIDLAANFAPVGTWNSSFDPGDAITSRDVITRVQQALGKLGFDVGTPDGVAGPKTTEAIEQFESGTGMSKSGKINPRLLAVLGSQPV